MKFNPCVKRQINDRWLDIKPGNKTQLIVSCPLYRYNWFKRQLISIEPLTDMLRNTSVGLPPVHQS